MDTLHGSLRRTQLPLDGLARDPSPPTPTFHISSHTTALGTILPPTILLDRDRYHGETRFALQGEKINFFSRDLKRLSKILKRSFIRLNEP